MEEQLLFEVFKGVDLNISLVDKVFKSTVEKQYEMEGESLSVRSNLQSQIESLKIKKNRLMDIYLNQRIEDSDFDKRLLSIENEIVAITSQLEKLPKYTDSKDTFEQAKKALETFKYNEKHFQYMTDSEKQKMVFLLLSNFTLKDRKIVNLQYHPPFDVISKPPKNSSFSVLSD